MRSKVTTTMYLEKYQLHALQEISRVTGVPMARMMRDALDAFLKSSGFFEPKAAEEEQ
jgi:hypothetical protein